MKHEDIKDLYNKEEYIGEQLTVCGWVKAIRKSKNSGTDITSARRY